MVKEVKVHQGSTQTKSAFELYTNLWELRGKVLVIAEKPKAARKIAEALSDKLITHKYKEIPYFEIKRGDLTIFVASATGHLYELHTETTEYPVFEYKWVPAYFVNQEKKYTRNYLELLGMLFKNCGFYVNACDYDIEGSVIGYMLIKFHGNEKRAYRAKFSSLTAPEIKTSFTKLFSLDYNMIEAGLCRHELDWIWGINISRALMKAIFTTAGKRVILSAGRVQTPTLKYIVEKDLERKLFIPLPQYTITAIIKKDSLNIKVDYSENPVISEALAKSVKDNVEKSGYLIVRSYNITRLKYNPPPPFNLSDLQEEAARIYGLSPMKTQEIAEQLYLDALISYPRTNSQKLPPTLNFREILSKLAKMGKYNELVTKLIAETHGVLKPVEGEKEDPAHPAIYPTGVLPQKLAREQAAIYDLIVRRFLAVFAPPATLLQVKLALSTPSNGHRFETSGLSIEYPGWMTYYPFFTPSSKFIPVLKQGEKLQVVKVIIRETYTKPSPKLKKIDILRWMEKKGIGTESTRAIIIEKLFDRNYLINTKTGVEVSELGRGVVEVIEDYFPDLISVDLTRKFEVLMDDIMKGKRRKENVIQEARLIISDLLTKFNYRINDVGLLLAKRLSLINNYDKCSIPGCRGDRYMNGLCEVHYRAYESVMKMYNEWKQRKNVTFEEYISKLVKIKMTGNYVKETIRYHLLRSKGPIS